MKRIMTVMFALGLAVTGCKKDDKKVAAGSAAVGSGSAGVQEPGMTPPGSGAPGSAGDSMAGSNAMAGSGSDSMAGSAGGAGPRPAGVTDQMVAAADKLVVVMDGLGADLKTAGTDCKKATAALKPRFDEFTVALKDMEKFKEEGDKDIAVRDWMKATYQGRMENSMRALMSTAMACKDDKDFAAMMQKFPLKKKQDAKGEPDAGTTAPAGSGAPPKM